MAKSIWAGNTALASAKIVRLYQKRGARQSPSGCSKCVSRIRKPTDAIAIRRYPAFTGMAQRALCLRQLQRPETAAPAATTSAPKHRDAASQRLKDRANSAARLPPHRFSVDGYGPEGHPRGLRLPPSLRRSTARRGAPIRRGRPATIDRPFRGPRPRSGFSLRPRIHIRPCLRGAGHLSNRPEQRIDPITA